MKRAISVSIGSSKRDKAVEVELLGETIGIERIGFDGDMEAAALKYKELDGTVDAFGVGGADLEVIADGEKYPIHSVSPMVRYISETPFTDGGGLKNTLEKKAPAFLDEKIGDYIDSQGRKVLITLGIDRWGISQAFVDAGYETRFGDLMFGLDIPLAVSNIKYLKPLAALVMPIAGRLPFHWVYPIGEAQGKREPKFGKHFSWATVIAGDLHYIKPSMPHDLTGKVIVTNTTTPDDVEDFRKAGVKYLITTTPVLEGRSFGTNMMEAAIIAISGKKRQLTWDELSEMIEKLGFEPHMQQLN